MSPEIIRDDSRHNHLNPYGISSPPISPSKSFGSTTVGASPVREDIGNAFINSSMSNSFSPPSYAQTKPTIQTGTGVGRGLSNLTNVVNQKFMSSNHSAEISVSKSSEQERMESLRKNNYVYAESTKSGQGFTQQQKTSESVEKREYSGIMQTPTLAQAGIVPKQLHMENYAHQQSYGQPVNQRALPEFNLRSKLISNSAMSSNFSSGFKLTGGTQPDSIQSVRSMNSYSSENQYHQQQQMQPQAFINRSYSPERNAAVTSSNDSYAVDVTSAFSARQPAASTTQSLHNPPAVHHATVGLRPNLFHASPLTEQLRQVLADRERASRDDNRDESYQNEDVWQVKVESESSTATNSLSSNVSSPKVEAKQLPEKWKTIGPLEWTNEQVGNKQYILNVGFYEYR